MNDSSGRTSDAHGPVTVTAVPRQAQDRAAGADVPAQQDRPQLTLVRRAGRYWRVADEDVPDLMSAMVLADLLAPELAAPQPPAAGPAGDPGGAAAEAARLRVTVAQLEHALATRVRVEQAIGVICERRRVPPREAFSLLRTVARASGLRVSELAARVVDSAVNPLLMLPEELARPSREPRARGRSPRHVRVGE
jgi:ANTAR domain